MTALHHQHSGEANLAWHGRLRPFAKQLIVDRIRISGFSGLRAK